MGTMRWTPIERAGALALALYLMGVASASGQPSLQSLWPNTDGLNWSYEGTLQEPDTPLQPFTARLTFDGATTMAPGVTVQRLIGRVDGNSVFRDGVPSHLDPLMRALWRGRPELRQAIAARERSKSDLGFWPFLLLSPSTVVDGTGHRQTANRIGAWRDMIGNWSWWYLTESLSPGSAFQLQLVPDLANDVFLNGEVRTDSGSVVTPAGTFEDAVIMDYVVDQGEGTITDENGDPLGTIVVETRGWVAFVPNVGPVGVHEEFNVLEVNCPTGCPPFDGQTGTLTTGEMLLSRPVVATEKLSLGRLKSRFAPE